MDNEFPNIDQIEKYLSGNMKSEELAFFEEKMKSDATFAEEVNLFRDMIKSVELDEEEALKATIAGVHKRFKNKALPDEPVTAKRVEMQLDKPKFNFRKLAIAASLLALSGMVLYLFLPKGKTLTKELYVEYYQPEKKALNGILDELESVGLGNPNQEEEDLLANALKSYENGAYLESINLLNSFLKVYPNNKLAKLYLGLSLMDNKEYLEATTFLETLANDDQFPQKNIAKWYAALSYSMLNTKKGLDKAKMFLQQLATNNNEYSKEAKAYLEKIGF